jgi:putative FmdB family regulatory protein
MPLFDYQCEACHAEVELLIRGDEKPKCPECHSTKMQKQLSAPAAHMASGGLQMSMPMGTDGGGCGKPQCGQGRCMGGM